MSNQIIYENPFFTLDKSDFIQILSSLKGITDEIKFYIDVNGLSIRTMDSTHVSLIDITIDQKGFYEFETKDQTIQFTIQVDESLKIIKSMDKGKIKMTIKKDNIELSQNGFITQLKRIESSDSDCPLPKIPYNSRFEFNKNSDIIQILKKFEANTDYIKMSVIDQTLEFEGSSDQGKSKMNFKSGNKVTIDSKDDSLTCYNLEYINPFLKSVNKENQITFEYSEIKPLRISQKFGTYGKIDFYLAPRIET